MTTMTTTTGFAVCSKCNETVDFHVANCEGLSYVCDDCFDARELKAEGLARATCPNCKTENDFDLPLDEDGFVKCCDCGAGFKP